ncbi:hypothetical protein [Allosphingosinicella humi]|jgi:hypothetical protein
MGKCRKKGSRSGREASGDLAKLRELGLVCSAEFVVQSSFPARSVERTSDSALPVASAAGRFIAARGAPFGADEVGFVLEELKQALGDEKQKSRESIDDLLELWAIAEPHLMEAEVQEFWPRILRRLSDGVEAAPVLSRSDERTGGGA